MKPTLSILIVNYNSREYLFNCLESVAKFLTINYEIIVVDSASTTDDLCESDFSKFKNVRFLKLPKNLGFGAANNFAAGKASGEFLLMLNPDTLLIDNSIEKMLIFYKKHDEIGASTCLLYQDDRKSLQENFFGKFQSLLGLTLRHYNYQRVDFSKEFFYTDIVTGACLLIRKELFHKIGGFDERIFMYLEDDDLCRRLVLKGFKNAVYTHAKIIHFEGKSSKNNRAKKKLYYESQSYYWKKHNGVFLTLLMKLVRWPYKFLRLYL